MPWHIENDNPDCTGWAVVKDADASIAGCHPTQAQAQDQLAALYANEPDMEAAAMQPEPLRPDPQVLQDEFDVAELDDLVNPEADDEDYAVLFPTPTDLTDTTPCYGVACIEGVPDGADVPRMWQPGALVFAPLPWSLKWQPAEDEGHEGAVVVGRVDTAWRDGALIRWTGVLDAASEAGREVARQIGQQFVRGISIKADDVRELEVEEIYPAPADPSHTPMVDGEPVDAATDDGDEFHLPGQHDQRDHASRKKPGTSRASGPQHRGYDKAKGRYIKPSGHGHYPAGWKPSSAQDTVTADAMLDLLMPQPEMCIYHHGRIRSLTIVAEPAYVEATISLGESPFQPVMAPSEDPLAAVAEMVDAEDAAARQALEPVVVAASYTITLPQIPPEEWFAQPSDEELAMCAGGGGAVHITPAGRVFGLLAPASVDHRAFRASGERVQVPRNIDYSEWQNKACIVAGADGVAYKINAGTVTYDCGHPSPFDPRRVDPSFASQHYDNSCSVAMRARAGEHPRYGTWFAGALARGLTADALERIMGCALSGDWQGGKLKAALLVPCEGFPVRGQASVRQRMGSLVASSVPLVYEPPPPPASFDALFALIAAATGRGPEVRYRELAEMRYTEIAAERG